MRRVWKILALALVCIVIFSKTPISAWGGMSPSAMLACTDFAFSVEQDFLTQGPVPADGNPLISDGDLLGLVDNDGNIQGSVCARNTDLVQGFDILVDLGLDAVDVIDAETYIVAFSTELNSSNQGQFTSGDLLVTNDAIIPNQALTFSVDATLHDVGLDGLHFIGDKQALLDFLDYASRISRETWLIDPGVLANELDARSIDIYFSTEATTEYFLDGDLLSAKSGSIIARNSDLLPSTVPAGIPVRGVDYGLDGLTGDRTGETAPINFSTELNFTGTPAFSEGDVLQFSGGVVYPFSDLIMSFEPKASSLGMDALFINISDTPAQEKLYLPLIMRGAP
jgi:hypothetical protein